MKNIHLLGCTGSVGQQTLEVIRSNPDRFTLNAMAFGSNVEKGLEIYQEFKPKMVTVKDESVKKDFEERLSDGNPVIMTGMEGLIACAGSDDADTVVNAVVGSLGLRPTLAAIEAGTEVALANKETLVTAGHIVMKAAKDKGVAVLPVDSEHSAIFQCLNGEKNKTVNRLILTASGGSFRDKSREELEGVTVQDALKHPNWSMGAKITIDSATMMNKGLEVIEAHWLFDMPYEKIDVIVHKESMIHSMVEYIDNSVIAQLGNPDMKGPIQYALTYPERLELANSKRLNLWETGTLHFEKADFSRFKSLRLAYEAGRTGGLAPTVLNGANEAAVALFLDGRIPFLKIDDYVDACLESFENVQDPGLQEIEEADRSAREFVMELAEMNK